MKDTWRTVMTMRSSLFRFLSLAPLAMACTGCASNLLAVHSDVSMGLATKMRSEPRQVISSCRDERLKRLPECVEQAQWQKFSGQLDRVSLQVARAAIQAFPELKERFPDAAERGFDVFFVDGLEPGFTSSGRGRIAVNIGTEKLKPTDDWLAFALALEVGRIVARHHESDAALSIGAGLVTGAVSSSLELVRNAASLMTGDLRSSDASPRDLESMRHAITILDMAGISSRQVLVNLKTGFRRDRLGDSGWARRYSAVETALIEGADKGQAAATAAE